MTDRNRKRIERESKQEIGAQDLSDIFGLLKGKINKTPQQLKEEAREGWE